MNTEEQNNSLLNTSYETTYGIYPALLLAGIATSAECKTARELLNVLGAIWGAELNIRDFAYIGQPTEESIALLGRNFLKHQP